jgi:hypothetical protein
MQLQSYPGCVLELAATTGARKSPVAIIALEIVGDEKYRAGLGHRGHGERDMNINSLDFFRDLTHSLLSHRPKWLSANPGSMTGISGSYHQHSKTSSVTVRTEKTRKQTSVRSYAAQGCLASRS